MMSGWGNHKFPKITQLNAKELRNNATLHEKILWKHLRKSQFMELKFRRQQPVGKYIADFLCCNPKIVIELDGGQHNEPEAKTYDSERTAFLESYGLRVLRFSNYEVNCHFAEVCDCIGDIVQRAIEEHGS